MESHLVRIINRLEAMAKDGGNLKRNFEREGVVVTEVAYSHDEEDLFNLPFCDEAHERILLTALT